MYIMAMHLSGVCTWQKASNFILRYSMDMTHKEYAIFLKLKYVLYSWDIIVSTFVAVLTSLPAMALNILSVYCTIQQDWSSLIIMQAFNSMVLKSILRIFKDKCSSKSRGCMYDRIVATYYIVNHSTTRVKLSEYVKVVLSCLGPAILLPGEILVTASQVGLTLFSICHLLYILRPNGYHLAVLILGVWILHRLMKARKCMDAQWAGYSESCNLYHSVDTFICQLLMYSEVPYVMQTTWIGLQSGKWRRIRSRDLLLKSYMSCYVFGISTALYLCTKGARVSLGLIDESASEDTRRMLTLSFIYVSIPSVKQLLSLLKELISPKPTSDSDSPVFPRILALIESHWNKTLKIEPISYPMLLAFPYRVASTDCSVKVVDLSGNTMQTELSVNLGDRVFVTGPSGCGKSSMFRQLFRMDTLEGSVRTHDGYVQWISEGVTEEIDFMYLTVEHMFYLNPTSNLADIGKLSTLSSEKLEFVKSFHLDSLYARCCGEKKVKVDSSVDGAVSVENELVADISQRYLLARKTDCTLWHACGRQCTQIR